MALAIMKANEVDTDVVPDIADIFVSNSGTEFDVFSSKKEKQVNTFKEAIRPERFVVAMEKPNRILAIGAISDGTDRTFAFDKAKTKNALGFYKGTMGFYSLSERFGSPVDLPAGAGLIEALAARGSGRHEGALSELLEYLLETTPYSELWVIVGDTNEDALSFYKEAGFEEVKREPYRYGQQGGHTELVSLKKSTNR